MHHEETRTGGTPPVEEKEAGPVAGRRRVVNLLLGGGLLSWMAVALFPVVKYLKPPPEAGGAGEKPLDDDDKKKIASQGFTIVRLGTDRVIVFQDSKKAIHALQAKCTHEGCTVTYKADEGLVWCACHNGKFGLDGRVISGPPPKPLALYAVRGTIAGKLSIAPQGA